MNLRSGSDQRFPEPVISVRSVQRIGVSNTMLNRDR